MLSIKDKVQIRLLLKIILMYLELLLGTKDTMLLAYGKQTVVMLIHSHYRVVLERR